MFRASSPGASLLTVLLSTSCAADKYQQPIDLLQDATFRKAYFEALGVKREIPWLAQLDGPAPTTRVVEIEDAQYILAAACKTHDCGENSFVLLYSAPKRSLYGLIYEAGRWTLLGAPPPSVADELHRFWKKEWRQE